MLIENNNMSDTRSYLSSLQHGPTDRLNNTRDSNMVAFLLLKNFA